MLFNTCVVKPLKLSLNLNTMVSLSLVMKKERFIKELSEEEPRIMVNLK